MPCRRLFRTGPGSARRGRTGRLAVAHAEHDAGRPAPGERHPPSRPGGVRRQPGRHRPARRVPGVDLRRRWRRAPSGWPRPCGASGSATTTGWGPSPGTTRSTSRPTWPSPPWGRCCTPSTSGSSPSSWPTSSTTPRTRWSSSTPRSRPLFARVRDECKTVEHIIVVGEGDTTGLGETLSYDELIDAEEPGYDWPAARRTPGGVDVLHERHHGQPQGRRLQPPLDVAARLRRHDGQLRGRQRDATACSSSCPCSTPTPGACPTRRSSPGPTSICPERFLQAEPLARIIAEQRPTLSLGVPTIWNDLLRYSPDPRRRPVVAAAAHGRRRGRAPDAHGGVPGPVRASP